MEEMNLRDVLVREYGVYHREATDTAANVLAKNAWADSEQARQELRLAVEELSGGENSVRYDNAGLPSVMVRVPAMRCRDLVDGCASDAVHPAFLFHGKVIPEIWVSKYQNAVVRDHPLSLPLTLPKRIADHDEAVTLARRKGEGWFFMPFQLQMAIALWCRRNGFLPRGNSDSGRNYFVPEETCTLADDGVETGIALTGSGPVTWAHNRRPSGIWDLTGNISDWTCCYRLMNGQLQFIRPEDLYASADSDLSVHSPLWQAMNSKGEYVAPDAPDTLWFDACEGGVRLTRRVEFTGIGNCAFADLALQEGLEAPGALRLLGLWPQDDHMEGWRWINTEGEAFPLCGGAYKVAHHGSVFFAGVTKPRGCGYTLAGMRCIYIDPSYIR